MYNDNFSAKNSANSDDLFDIMNSVIPQDVLERDLGIIMNSWVNNPGYPVITVQRNNKTGNVRLTQKRFFIEKTENQDETAWWIPITYVTEESPQSNITQFWFRPYNKNNTHIKDVNANHWLLLNVNQTGMCTFVIYYHYEYQYINIL